VARRSGGEDAAGRAREPRAHGGTVGVVAELLPSALFRVEIEGGRRATSIVAHMTGSPQRNFVRLVVGDRVVVELAPNDRGRGRIVRKL
jgi:translation initiation factor IF-1